MKKKVDFVPFGGTEPYDWTTKYGVSTALPIT